MASLDYTVIPGRRITLHRNMMTAQVSVPLVNDNLFEEDEVFTGELRTTTMEIDSNAPKEMKCQLCEESCRKVRISIGREM